MFAFDVLPQFVSGGRTMRAEIALKRARVLVNDADVTRQRTLAGGVEGA